MGRHHLINKKAYRQKQNLRKRQKKRKESILTRGNVICNCAINLSTLTAKTSYDTTNEREQNTNFNKSDTDIVINKSCSELDAATSELNNHSISAADDINNTNLSYKLTSKCTNKVTVDDYQQFRRTIISDPLYVGMKKYEWIKNKKLHIESKENRMN